MDKGLGILMYSTEVGNHPKIGYVTWNPSSGGQLVAAKEFWRVEEMREQTRRPRPASTGIGRLRAAVCQQCFEPPLAPLRRAMSIEEAQEMQVPSFPSLASPCCG